VLRADIIYAESEPTTSGSAGTSTADQRQAAPFFKDLISWLEVPSSLLSDKEKSALQLIELRAKAARIQQSLPDWVRNGLVPPRRNPSPPATSLGQQLVIAERDGVHHPTRDALHTKSCHVRADIGFLSGLQQPAAARGQPQQDSIEKLLFGVVRLGASGGAEQIPPSGQQAAAHHDTDEVLENSDPHCYSTAVELTRLGDGVDELPPKAPAPKRSLLARLFGALARFASHCLQSFLHVCCRGGGARNRPSVPSPAA
jgi:hypothetical protein